MFELILILLPITLGYFFGRYAEKKHYKSILRREAQTLNVPLITMKTVPENYLPCTSKLVSGNVVISIDYFKRILAGLRNIVGGRMKSYETLLDRARREAILRMKESAIQSGARMVVNVRIETSSINKNSRRKQAIGSVEVLAYGTAII